jgi:hypothetical protein
MFCQHCQERHAYRPRGLCNRCYYMPGVRYRYHLPAKAACRPADVEEAPICPAGAPTTALPGSLAKLAVLQQRASRGEALFHPADPSDFRPSMLTYSRVARAILRGRSCPAA